MNRNTQRMIDEIQRYTEFFGNQEEAIDWIYMDELTEEQERYLGYAIDIVRGTKATLMREAA